MMLEETELQRRVQQLEKENRVLHKKLERATATCLQLEETARKKEALLRQVIHELKASEASLENQSRALEHTLTDLKRTQTQLIQAEKMSSLGQLVAGVAHEINNPVNFIHGNLTHVREYAQALLRLLQLYEQHYPKPAPAIQAEAEAVDLEFLQADLLKTLDSMKMGTDRIRQMVLSLRNFSRMDEAEVKGVDIHEGIDCTLMLLQSRLQAKAKQRAIQVVKAYGPLPTVSCYAGQLNQVFMNLLSNAIDALEATEVPEATPLTTEEPHRQPTLYIHTAVADEHHIQIRIADNGVGMPAAVQSRIFDPFFTTKAVGKGTGMGLAISYQIVTERHQGHLHCTSTPGQGTEFVIEIPLQQPEPPLKG